METYLKPFLISVTKLNSGILCQSPDKGKFLCKAVLLCGTADLPARRLLCNHVQYKGAFSCWKCEHEGESATVRRGHARIFLFQNENPKGQKRAMKNVRHLAREAAELQQVTMGRPVKGIKGPLWLHFAQQFNIVSGIANDYMHGVLLGV